MFNRTEMIMVLVVGMIMGSFLIVQAAVPKSNNTPKISKPAPVSQEGLVRIELAEEAAKIASKCLAVNKRLTVLARELEKTISAISLEEPTKERVVLMVMLSELIAIKSCLAGGFLTITSLPFIIKEGLPDAIKTARVWLYNFYGLSLANSLFNLGHHADLSEHKELVKKIVAEYNDIGATYASYFEFFKKAQEASRELNEM